MRIRCLADRNGCMGMKPGGPDNEELGCLITCTHQAASPPLRQHDRSYPCSIDSIKRFILTPAPTGLFFRYNHGSQCFSPVGRIKRTLFLTVNVISTSHPNRRQPFPRCYHASRNNLTTILFYCCSASSVWTNSPDAQMPLKVPGSSEPRTIIVIGTRPSILISSSET